MCSLGIVLRDGNLMGGGVRLGHWHPLSSRSPGAHEKQGQVLLSSPGHQVLTCKCWTDSNLKSCSCPKAICAGQHPQGPSVQVPLSPGDDTAPIFCWLTHTGFRRWKWLNTALVYWMDCGNCWDFLLFSPSLLKSFTGQIRWLQTKDGRPAGSMKYVCLLWQTRSRWGRHTYGVCFCLWYGKCLLWTHRKERKLSLSRWNL